MGPRALVGALAVLLTAHRAWAAAGAATTATTPASVVYLGPLVTLAGEPTHGNRLLSDEARFTVRGEGVVTEVDRAERLLLVVSHASCEWTARQLEELAASAGEFRRAGVRVAAVLRTRGMRTPQDFASLAGRGLRILEDRDGGTYRRAVGPQTPAVVLVARSGVPLLRVDGYVPTASLLDRIHRKDYGAVAPAGG